MRPQYSGKVDRALASGSKHINGTRKEVVVRLLNNPPISPLTKSIKNVVLK